MKSAQFFRMCLVVLNRVVEHGKGLIRVVVFRPISPASLGIHRDTVRMRFFDERLERRVEQPFPPFFFRAVVHRVNVEIGVEGKIYGTDTVPLRTFE